MKKALKYVGYALAALIIFALAQEHKEVSYIFVAAWLAMVIREIVKQTIKEVLWEELMTLRQQSHENRERSEAIDRKVSAIWDRIRAISAR